MNPKVRLILGVLAGVLAGVAVLVLNERMLPGLFLVPPGDDPLRTAQTGARLKQLAPTALAVVATIWAAAAFTAGLFAGYIGKSEGRRASMAVGIVFLAAAFINLISLPHPIGMWAAGLALPLPCALLGGRITAPKLEYKR